MNKILKLGDVLLNVAEFEWSDALFLVRDEVWGLDSKCAVLDLDDIEDDADEEPLFAMNNNLKYALSMQDFQGIVENAHEQKSCTQNDLLKAFLYYYNNDAFITF